MSIKKTTKKTSMKKAIKKQGETSDVKELLIRDKHDENIIWQVKMYSGSIYYYGIYYKGRRRFKKLTRTTKRELVHMGILESDGIEFDHWDVEDKIGCWEYDYTEKRKRGIIAPIE